MIRHPQQFTAIHSNPQIRSVPELCYLLAMVVARHEFADLIARAFDGAVVVDGLRVIAHKSGIHCVRGAREEAARPIRVDRRAIDPDNDWSDV